MGGKKMYAFQKRNLNKHPCGSEDVCRIEDGSTNEYLKENRVIEDFLKFVEPNYNSAIEKLRSNRIDGDSIFVISGFISYIMACAPAAMRLNGEPLRKMVEAEAAILDRQGGLPPPPKVLGGNTISELLAQGKIVVDVDEKYPQALAVAGILGRVSQFGNFHWDIIINDEHGSPFFTSDFPITIEQSSDPRVLNRIVPLAPDLAIRIRPSLARSRDDIDLSFPHFRCRTLRPSHSGIRYINDLIVKCAENFVFYRDDCDWVEPFISKRSQFWIETHSQNIPHGRGYLTWSTMRIAKRTD